MVDSMSTPFHSEITPITLEDALAQCEDLIQVYEEASSMLNVKQLLSTLREMVHEKGFTNNSVALSIIDIFEVYDPTIDMASLFKTLAEKEPTAVWNTALELNLILEHCLETDDY